MGELRVALADGAVSYPDGQIVSELEAFKYKYTATHTLYSAPDGFYDDCVDALALAVHCYNENRHSFRLLVA